MKDDLKILALSCIVMLAIYFSDVIMFILTWAFRILFCGLGLLLVLFCVAIVSDNLRSNRLTRFLRKSNGRYFLMYGSNKRIREVVERSLEAVLSIEYERIIYRNGTADSTILPEQIAYLRKGTDMIKFPRLIFVRNGKIRRVSFFEEVCDLRLNRISYSEFEKKVKNKIKIVNNE